MAAFRWLLSLLVHGPGPRRGLLIPIISLAAAWLGPADVDAQIDLPEYGLTIRSFQEGCPSTNVCEGASGVSATGEYEILIYAGGWWGFDGFRFTIDMPADWTVIDYKLCGETAIVSGDPLAPWETLEIETPGCWNVWDFIPPVMTLRVDCASPGPARFRGPDGASRPSGRSCSSGEWSSAFPGYVDQRVNVGDFCGRLDFRGPCEYCELQRAATFVPSTQMWTLAPGTSAHSTLLVRGTVDLGCGLTAECGGSYYEDADCFGGLDQMPSWLTAEYLYSDGFSRHFYELTADATGLLPGEYEGRMWAFPSCPTCTGMCTSVNLSVVGPSSAPGSPAAIGAFSLRTSPNPVEGLLSCSLTLEEGERVALSLYDSQGRLAAEVADRYFDEGSHTIQFNTAGLVAGPYFLRADAGREMKHQKILVR